jgi:hypothetical protein
MPKRGWVIGLIIVGLAVAPSVYADMTPASGLAAGGWQSRHVCVPTDPGYTSCLSPFGHLSITDVPSLSVEFLPQTRTDVEAASQTQPVLILADQTGSFNLCVYALMGLGLCGSVHGLKKASLGSIPEWYHDGGPFQIGHSYAIGPDALCSCPVLCFIQPDCTADDISPEYYKGTIAPLLRKSQFTPTVVAARGPPETA